MPSFPRRVLLLSALFVLSACAVAPRPLAITDVSVVDVEGGEILPSATVLIRNDRIVAMGTDIRVPASARRVNGAGRFLIPGLWDMHTHHQATGEESLPIFVALGVTGTRDMGSDASFILPLRGRVDRGEVLGPRITAAGPMLDAAPADWPWRRQVTTAEEGAQAVEELRREGVDFIKVHDTTPREAYFAIADAARQHGLPLVGHVPATVTVSEAVAAGQRSIEHYANFRIFSECPKSGCAALYDSFAENQVWQAPTLAFWSTVPSLLAGEQASPSSYASPGLRKVWRENRADGATANAIAEMGERAATKIPEMNRHKVGFLAGCDGLVPGFCLHDELERFTAAGLSPVEALRTATINPARYFGREASEGSVATGRRADLVILDANPLADIRHTRRIHAVVLGGRLYDRRALDQMLSTARETFARSRE